DGRAADEPAAGGVLEDEEVALLAVEADLGGEGRLGRGDLVAQAAGVVRQRSDAHRAVRSQTLYLGKVGHLRGAHHQHGVTPLQLRPAWTGRRSNKTSGRPAALRRKIGAIRSRMEPFVPGWKRRRLTAPPSRALSPRPAWPRRARSDPGPR